MFGICPESTDIHFPRGHGPMGINLHMRTILIQEKIQRQLPKGLEIADFGVAWIHRFQITSIHIRDASDFRLGAWRKGNVLPPNDVFKTLNFT
jgi:hypothetical protein